MISLTCSLHTVLFRDTSRLHTKFRLAFISAVEIYKEGKA